MTRNGAAAALLGRRVAQLDLVGQPTIGVDHRRSPAWQSRQLADEIGNTLNHDLQPVDVDGHHGQGQDAGAGGGARAAGQHHHQGQAAWFGEIEQPTVTELRDRALIGVMVYTFARVNAVIGMKVKDYFTQGRRGWVHLPQRRAARSTKDDAQHTLEKFLDEYITAAGIKDDADGPLRTASHKTKGPRGATAMWQHQGRCNPIQRRAKAAGIKTKIGNHTFRATGITASV